MSDTPAPFSPFSPSPPPTPMFEEGNATGKKPRKKPEKAVAKPKRKWERRAVKASPVPLSSLPTHEEATAELLKIKKKRDNANARKPRPVTIGIEALSGLGGLGVDEMKSFMTMVGNMRDVPKKSRLKIVAALGKVFG